jgi:hypothetical protein
MEELLQLNTDSLSSVSLIDFLIGFSETVIFSLIILWIYNRFSLSVANKKVTSSLFPLFAASIFIIVITIKSSIVLSLGLVGALSIIRFRTAVKEQEQIIYLLILTGISISTAAGSFLYPFAFIIFIFIYSFFRYKNSIKVSQTVNDQLIIKGENISEENISSVINLISADSNVVIQSINKTKNLDTIVLKVSDFSFDKFSVIQSFLENEDINSLSTQYFSSTDI